MDGYSAELVPAPLGPWGEEERARLLLLLGYALFDDVGRMVGAGVRLR